MVDADSYVTELSRKFLYRPKMLVSYPPNFMHPTINVSFFVAKSTEVTASDWGVTSGQLNSFASLLFYYTLPVAHSV